MKNQATSKQTNQATSQTTNQSITQPNTHAFDKIIGYEWVKDELRILASVLRNAKDYTSRGCELPHGLMFEGEPGLGKTLMAQCFIEASGCKSYTVRKTSSGNSFLEDLQATFDQAIEYSSTSGDVSIILLDDLDKFSSANETRNTTEEFSAVQSGMEQCKGHPVFIVATVNKPYMLPDSLRRHGRFGKTLKINSPSVAEHEEIVAKYLHDLQETFKDVKIDTDVEFLTRLFRIESFSTMEEALNYAVIRAIHNKRKKISQKDVIEALVGYKLDSNGPNFAPFFEKRDEKRMQIAIHEAGHVVVAEALAPKSVVFAAIVHNGGGIGGHTRHSLDRDAMNPVYCDRTEIAISLGGLVAADRELGLKDGGASSDVNKMVSVAGHLVEDIGIYGLRNAANSRGRSKPFDMSDQYAAAEIENCREKVVTILAENREFLLEVASIIYEKGLATYSDIQKTKMCLRRNASPNTDAFAAYDVA